MATPCHALAHNTVSATGATCSHRTGLMGAPCSSACCTPGGNRVQSKSSAQVPHRTDGCRVPYTEGKTRAWTQGGPSVGPPKTRLQQIQMVNADRNDWAHRLTGTSSSSEVLGSDCTRRASEPTATHVSPPDTSPAFPWSPCCYVTRRPWPWFTSLYILYSSVLVSFLCHCCW